MIMFCLPYAGGSESIFYSWKNHLDSNIDIYPIKLKGRGARYHEAFYENLEEAVQDIFEQVQSNIKNRDYAIFGHSMGSLLAYELYYKICEANLKKPLHIFFSGFKAPHRIQRKEILHTLPDPLFKKKIKDLGGTPEELIDHEELFALFLPLLKSDFKMVETYLYKERDINIDCDITILNGIDDEIDLNDILEWENHTAGHFEYYDFPGNHFYIHHQQEHILHMIKQTLKG
ncbi:thioesterase [Bacillus sp. WMMC1349]|uniref:thioesterase II family protein n=1 Tax=Bacillus sp. WMMC1349 TaxID=2736254 RepID=UPI0015535670|nr:thioesterase [Bacillus sp. WMMC1349]NPC93189.1 thioesterase [Bacillus sp. WMMC1349]